MTRAVDHPECYMHEGSNAQDTVSQTYKTCTDTFLTLFNIYYKFHNEAMRDGSLLYGA
jgi:hypothetical protein